MANVLNLDSFMAMIPTALSGSGLTIRIKPVFKSFDRQSVDPLSGPCHGRVTQDDTRLYRRNA
ncbi:MAG TPA: hypothetical protein VF509_10100 [Sphingobium sp.]